MQGRPHVNSYILHMDGRPPQGGSVSYMLSQPRGTTLDTSHLGWRLLRLCLYSNTPGVYLPFVTVSAVRSCIGVRVEGVLVLVRFSLEQPDPTLGYRTAIRSGLSVLQFGALEPEQ